MGERLNFADRIHLADKVEQLEAENAELREQVASLINRSFRVADKMQCLNIENEKLRKLVKVLLECHVENADTCARCPFKSPLHGGCMADVEADEFGIEVNG